ncbi:lipoprotein signal peptidase [Aureispira]|nr:lipoprotein signal peptidase [Aureispira sp.]
MKKTYFVILIIFLVLILDQSLKIWVKMNMPLGGSFEVLGMSWFHIHFIENPGMAFGIEWGGNLGKLGLSLFRIIAICVIGYMLHKMVNKNASIIVLTSISLIFAGAIGNILDSVFYGLIFSKSTAFEIATLLPEEGGYTDFLLGKVVDMFYFPIIDSSWPEWIPLIGGNSFQFFEFIFNIADASVFIGTAMVFVFYKHFFTKTDSIKEELQKPSEEDLTELTN